MPGVLTPDMRDPDVVVADPADDPRAVDVAEGSQYLAQVHGGDCHVPYRRSARDRKSTRLNSSHSQISYAVFCLKKKKHDEQHHRHSAGTHFRRPAARAHLT